ncbi:alanine--tRNA ligase [Sarracenia purpurea var. burkii]
MGDTGPCGPCTEIHFDRVGNRDAASLVNMDDPTCIEIWNLVFIQFNREGDGSLKPLPAKHVDTGMGFERLTSILQRKMSNYDTDVFLPIFDAIQQATGARPYSGKVGPDDADKVDMAYRVVADHIRTLTFAIADGSYPGNEGREYVLRRILRRAVRYGTEVLKAQPGFFNGLVKVVVQVMGNVFPELRQHEVHIGEVVAGEEASFGKTLLNGIEKFKRAAQDVQGKMLSGQDAFILWDTYGFPLDLTQLMAEERGLVVDIEGFDIAMNEARERSRNAQTKRANGTIVMDADATSTLHKRGIVATNDSFKFTWFQDHVSVVKAIYTGREFLESAIGPEEVGVILETTSFYAEQGGQPVKPDELRKIESIVNEQIKAELEVYAKEANLTDAKRIKGLRAVFGEVYPDPVRVVSIGREVEDLLADPENEEWLSISAELCGGTHISNTREAKAFALLSEEGIAKGIRRVTAVTTDCAFRAIELALSLEQDVKEASKTDGSLLEEKVTYLNGRVESAAIPSARKADLKAKISVLQNQVIKAKKRIAEENIQKAVQVAIDTAEVAASDGKAFCISHVNVGSDTTAIREAVVRVMEQKVC